MKIAYVVPMDISTEKGIWRKILATTRAWQDLGHEASIFTLVENSCLACQDELVQFIQVPNSLRGRWVGIRELAAKVRFWGPDVVYARFSLYHPELESLAATFPVVLEINSLDLKEYWVTDKAKWFFHLLTRHRYISHAAGLVGVTTEITESFRQSRAPKATIANGIDLDSLEPLEPTDSARPTLFFIGTPGYAWHGLDHIIEMAAYFPEWRFHVVGLDKPNKGAPENIEFHGYLQPEEYRKLARESDVGIGTLALYRKGFGEASPLKVREYLALGLPIIIGYKDTDFVDGGDFILELPNRPDQISSSTKRIRHFVEGWRGRRVQREQISHIASAAKEQTRLRFLEEVLSRWIGTRGTR